MQYNFSTSVKYMGMAFIGIVLIIVCSKIQNYGNLQSGEYHYSSFLNNNYTILCGSLLLVTGTLIGYYSKLNPWLSGLFLILVFPVTSLYEATVYRGSHNLIPFELIIYFLYSLPAAIGVYMGRFVRNRKNIEKNLE